MERSANILVRVLLTDYASECLRLFEVGSFRFEPEEVGHVGEGERALQSGLDTIDARQFRPGETGINCQGEGKLAAIPPR